MFRMIGDRVEILRYKVTYLAEERNRETDKMEKVERITYAASEGEKDELLAMHDGATAEALDTDGIEWLDGLQFDSFEEAERALATGAYLPKKSLEQLAADIDYIAIMTGVDL